MKKTFLKFVFAVTMGISLLAGASPKINSSNNFFSSSATDSDNKQITLSTTQSYVFENAESVTLSSGDSIKVSGNKITAVGVGQSTVQVDDDNYTITVNLPEDYVQLDYLEFASGAYIDTGYIFSSNNFRLTFHFYGALNYGTFGNMYNNVGISPAGWKLALSSLKVGEDFNNANNIDNFKGPFDLNVSNGNGTLKFKKNSFPLSNVPSIITDRSFWFGSSPHAISSNYFYTGRLYDLSIESEGSKVRNYIPCMDSKTKALGFIDTLTNTFITSSTTKAFMYKYDSQLQATYKTPKGETSTIRNGYLYVDKNKIDFKNVKETLIFEDETYLRFPYKSNVSIDTSADTIDLTQVWPTTNVGSTYTMNMHKGSIVSTIRLYIGDSTTNPDMLVSIDESISSIHSSKTISGKGTMTFNFGEKAISCNVTKFNIRGNHSSTAENAKNSYNITMEEAVELIPGAGKNRKYSLVQASWDSTNYKNAFAYTLYQKISHTNAIDYIFVNLSLNGSPRGCYMLTEKVTYGEGVIDIQKPKMTEGTGITDVIKGKTIDISKEEQEIFDKGITRIRYCKTTTVQKDGGYILEAGQSLLVNCGFITSHGNSWEIKEPDNPSIEQISKIAIHMQEVEDALFSTLGVNSNDDHYSDLLDLDSLAREYLVRCFMQDGDFYIASNYLYIDGDETGLKGKMYAGPVWDFDWLFLDDATLYNNRSGAINHCKNFREKLIEKGDFVSKLYNINLNEFNSILTEMLKDGSTAELIKNSYSNLLSFDSLINGSSTNIASIISSLKNRKSTWETIWSDTTNALRGVTVENKGTYLEAVGAGINSYQWYKAGDSEPIKDAIYSTYAPLDNDEYYVVVTGNTSLAGTSVKTMTSNYMSLAQATIEFNMNGHGSQIDTQNVNIGEYVARPSNPYASGYVFKGWYKEIECINRWSFANDTATTNTVLYAKWVEGGTLFSGSTLSLCDNTWLNTYTELVDDDYDQYTFTYQIRDGEETKLPSDLFKKVDGRYRLSVILLPYQLADDITFKMYDLKGHLICTKVDSVRSYGTRLLANSKDQNEKDAMIALLNYGAAVQKLRGYHVDDLANRDLPKNP